MGAGATLVGVGSAVAIVYHYESELPGLAELKTYKPSQTTRVLARDGTLLAELFVERRTVVSVKDLPPQVKLAFLAAEDAGFYDHEGINYGGIARALLINLKSGRKSQGGSTITQQVVKNMLLDSEKTYRRKVREMLLARKLEQELGKDEILELYLNHIYFGHGRYGIEEAAKDIFGKSAKLLTIGEAALLAGVPKGPEIYSPRRDLKQALHRRVFVLDQMHQKGFLTDAQFAQAKDEPVNMAPTQDARTELAPEAVQIARKMLHELEHERAALGGYTITTTLDPKMQAAARKAVRDSLVAYDKKHGFEGPLKLTALAKGKDGKPLLVQPKGKDVFEGTPTYESHKVYTGVVLAHDDAQGTLDVRVGTAVGMVKLSDYARYNPKDLPASTFAPNGVRVRVSLLAPLPEKHAEQKSPPVPVVAPVPTTSGSTGSRTLEHKNTGKTKLVRTADGKKADAGAKKGTEKVAEKIEFETTYDKTAPKVPLRLELGPQAAFVALDVRTREVRALVGSYEAIAGGLDRATQSRRQPGSTFKPIVYSYALHARRFTAASMVDPNPVGFGNYKPVNYEGWTARDPLRLREALANSVNVVAVRVLDDVGPERVVEWGKALGIESTLKPDLSLALGSYEVRPIEIAGAYATFAGGGTYEAPRIISRIVGPDGREIPLPDAPPSRRVMDEAEAYLITSMLTSVVDHGTAQRAKELKRPVAGKTGTSNDAKDVWFAGYSPEIVATVWIGYDDNRPLGRGETGGSTALPAWISFMRAAHEGKPRVDFARPSSITTARIGLTSGKLAREGSDTAMDEVFLQGTEPTELEELIEPDAGAGLGDAGATSFEEPDTASPE